MLIVRLIRRSMPCRTADTVVNVVYGRCRVNAVSYGVSIRWSMPSRLICGGQSSVVRWRVNTVQCCTACRYGAVLYGVLIRWSMPSIRRQRRVRAVIGRPNCCRYCCCQYMPPHLKQIRGKLTDSVLDLLFKILQIRAYVA
jgi:hypothetical protein